MKKGFTLVELLAVIVILAIIAVITIPMIKGVIDKVKLGSLEDSVYGLKSAAELYFSSNEKIETTEFICSDNGCISDAGKKLDYKGKVEGKVKLFSDGKVSICLTDDNYASSILANDKKATTKMGGCDEETYEISEVIAIEKYNKVNSDYLLVKNTLYNKTLISNINNDANTISQEINNYSLGVNKLTDSLYNKTVITSKENTFEQMASEVDNLDLNQGEAENKRSIVEGLKYSGFGITEDMTWDEIADILSNKFPEFYYDFVRDHPNSWGAYYSGTNLFTLSNKQNEYINVMFRSNDGDNSKGGVFRTRQIENTTGYVKTIKASMEYSCVGYTNLSWSNLQIVIIDLTNNNTSQLVSVSKGASGKLDINYQIEPGHKVIIQMSNSMLYGENHMKFTKFIVS